MTMAAYNLVRMRTLGQVHLDNRLMRVKRLEMGSDQVEMGLNWGGLAPESTRIIKKRVLTSAAKLCAVGISAAC
jgi:hypothetical protein